MINRCIIVIAVLLVSLHGYSQRATSDVNRPEKYNLSESLLKEWKKDFNGCLNLRCKYIDSLQNKALIGMPLPIFIKLFGKSKIKPQGDCYTYDLCTKCDLRKPR